MRIADLGLYPAFDVNMDLNSNQRFAVTLNWIFYISSFYLFNSILAVLQNEKEKIRKVVTVQFLSILQKEEKINVKLE
jgi:hypothetical protein